MSFQAKTMYPLAQPADVSLSITKLLTCLQPLQEVTGNMQTRQIALPRNMPRVGKYNTHKNKIKRKTEKNIFVQYKRRKRDIWSKRKEI